MRETEKGAIGKARALRRNMTRAEVVLWQKLRRRQLSGHRFRRQMPLGPYIVDFACVDKKLIVEVNGETHSSPAEQAHDLRRTQYMAELGWRVYRVWNIDVYNNLEGVLEGIFHNLENENSD